MANIIKRIDYQAWSDRINAINFFCATCDSKGEGGHGGLIATIENPDSEKELSKMHCFCPTCGDKLDWNAIKQQSNWLR